VAQRSATPAERDCADRLLAAAYGNLGRFRERHRIVDRMLAAAHAGEGDALSARIADALFWDGDTTAGHNAAFDFEQLAAASSPDYAAEIRASLVMWRFLETGAADRDLWESRISNRDGFVRSGLWELGWSLADAVIRSQSDRARLLEAYDSAAVASGGLASWRASSGRTRLFVP
jgi:hypothetical protein